MLIRVVLRLVLLLSAATASSGKHYDPAANCRSSAMSAGRRRRLGIEPCGVTEENGSCVPLIVVDDSSDEISVISDGPMRMYDGEAIPKPYAAEERNCLPVLTLHGELLAVLGNCSSLDDLPPGFYYPLRCNGVVRAAEASDAAGPPDFFFRYTTRTQPGFYELNCSMLDYAGKSMWEARVFASWEGIGVVRYDVCVKSGGHTCTNQTAGSRKCPYLHDFSLRHRDRGLRNKIMLGGFIVSVVFVLSFCLGLYRKRSAVFLWIRRRSAGEDEYFETYLRRFQNFAPARYKYCEVEKITSRFSQKLGQGGYGSVYRGQLEDGLPVAVKVLRDSKGSVKDFFSEVITIGCTYHVNIVTLLGFCSEGSKRVLIYEFMPNGSLDKFIFHRKQTPSVLDDAAKLLEISVGVARGLEYLHHGCNVGILHFDIKPHNILLDGSFCPKIADFGLARLCRSGESRIRMSNARGTVGYIAPEVCSGSYGGVSSKSDVYSYGMMLLEMVGGRKNLMTRVDRTSEVYFPDWICRHIDSGGRSLMSLVGLKADGEEEITRRMAAVGLWCIQTEPSDRPSMTKVLDMLEGRIQELQMPPLPAIFSSPRRPLLQSLTTEESEEEALIHRTTELEDEFD